MTSRERVTASLERREVDRVPMDLTCGGPNSAMDALLAHFGVTSDTELREMLDIDIRYVYPRYLGPAAQPPLGLEMGAESEFGGTEYMKCDFEGSGKIAGTYADDMGSRPFRHFTSVKEIENYRWPRAEWFDFSSLKEECSRYRDHAVICGGWAPLISRVFELFGMEKALLHFHDRPDLIRATI